MDDLDLARSCQCSVCVHAQMVLCTQPEHNLVPHADLPLCLSTGALTPLQAWFSYRKLSLTCYYTPGDTCYEAGKLIALDPVSSPAVAMCQMWMPADFCACKKLVRRGCKEEAASSSILAFKASSPLFTSVSEEIASLLRKSCPR